MPGISIFVTGFIVSLSPLLSFGQLLPHKLAKDRIGMVQAVVSFAPSIKADGPAAADALPTITKFTPTSAGPGILVKIEGTNFTKDTKVTFGGVEGTDVKVGTDGKVLTVKVGKGATGEVVVTNNKGSATANNFTFVPAPTITGVSPDNFTTGTKIDITGTNFIPNVTQVYIDDIPLTPSANTSTVITVTTSGAVSNRKIVIVTAGGTASWPTNQAIQGNADLTLPDLGSGLTIIPTPTFSYTQVHQSGNLGFNAIVWGNSLGTDSTRQKVGNKFLLPQTSLFGLKIEGAVRLTHQSSKFSLLLDGEVNFLVKKVSFYNVDDKSTLSFNPFVVHPKLGLTSSFFNDNFFASAYWHFLNVLTENKAFADFFHTGARNVFVYPELNVGSIFDISHGGSQSMKIELTMLINNGDAQNFYSSANNVIPYLKISFLSKL